MWGLTQTTRVKNASVQTAEARRKSLKRIVKLYNEFLNVEVDFDPQNTADAKTSFQNLWESCFKMKPDHCKNQGARIFRSEKPLVKLKVRIEIEQHYNDLCKRPGAHGQILWDMSRNLIG